MEKISEINKNMSEQSPKGAFSDLPPKIAELLSETLAEKIDLNHFFKSIEGVPGKDNFYKRLRTGTKVNVLRESGELEVEGWIIDPMPEKNGLNNATTIRVHNKKSILLKLSPDRFDEMEHVT